MNLQLHHVISDLDGKTGMAIVDAILAGERNPQTLAKLRDPRTHATSRPSPGLWPATVAASTCLPCASRWRPFVSTQS